MLNFGLPFNLLWERSTWPNTSIEKRTLSIHGIESSLEVNECGYQNGVNSIISRQLSEWPTWLNTFICMEKWPNLFWELSKMYGNLATIYWWFQIISRNDPNLIKSCLSNSWCMAKDLWKGIVTLHWYNQIISRSGQIYSKSIKESPNLYTIINTTRVALMAKFFQKEWKSGRFLLMVSSHR